jgi:hypothetical protein
MKFLSKKRDFYFQSLCVNNNYIVVDDIKKDLLFFCDHDLSVINTISVSLERDRSLTCTNNAMYLIGNPGVFPCTSHGLAKERLFDNFYIFRLAADIETNLLYFICYHNKAIFVGNEEGKVLYQLLCTEVCRTTFGGHIFVSNDILIILNYGSVILHNKDGQEICQVTDRCISGFSICLVHDKGILVTVEQPDNQIILWRTV